MLATILQKYDVRPQRMEFLGQNGGFSGAEFWRLQDPRGVWCLRCWPAQHPSRERLREIHQTLLHAQRGGFKQAAVPRTTTDGGTFSEVGGRLWELAPWMPGAPHRTTPAPPARVTAAMKMLAMFHQATRSLAQLPARVEAIAQRAAQLQAFQQVHTDVVAGLTALDAGLATSARRITTAFPAAARQLAKQLDDARNLTAQSQPCVRDVWRDNVLFTADEVTGLVDFGAMRMGVVAMDISRLLGSLAGDDAAAWSHGLQAYGDVRPLSGADVRLVRLLDRCFVVMAGMQWLVWLCLEGRKFGNPVAVGTRLCEIAERLDNRGPAATADW